MAFKKLYECEFCGKTKYFFPEQAIDAKCECEETNIDLNNTWCEATEENYEALYHLGLENGISLNIKTDKYLYIINSNIESTSLNLDVVINIKKKIFKQIHLVNGKFEFVESKPKNNFKEYGFKADFEGEILKEVKELKGIEYLGYFVGGNKTHYPCIWTKSGRIWKTSVSEKDRELYNLKPIKKEWYENPDNFPCIVIYEEKEIKLMRSYSETSKHRKEPCLLTSDGGIYHSLDKCRPATKEEILSLLVK